MRLVYANLGSFTFWFSDEACATWLAAKRKTRGSQPRYSHMAIETTLTLGLVFGLPLRLIEGFVTSLLQLMGLDLPVPDHTTLSRRSGQCKQQRNRVESSKPDGKPLHVVVDGTGLKIYGAGQWHTQEHAVKTHRQWRKLHIAIDADSGEVIAEVLTGQNTSDVSQLVTLLDQIETSIDRLTADGAYDGQSSYDTINRHSPSARIIIPPHPNSIVRDMYGPPTQRQAHVISLVQDGKMQWQADSDYGMRSLIETTMSRCQRNGGHRLNARSLINQKAEASRRCNMLNRMLLCARPKSVRVKETIA